MTLVAYLAGSTTGIRIKLGQYGLTSNADGSPGIGGVTFDDPDGTLSVRGWMKIVVEETDCIEAPVLFSGYIFDRKYSRSDGSATYRSGKARFINCNLVDENAVLHMRLITGLDGKRPAETRNDRLQWLLESAYLKTLIDDTSLVSSGEENFEEASYLSQYADDVLSDISAPINRIFFVYLTQPEGDRGLFFDRATVAISDSTLSISNDLDDITFDANENVTGTVIPPFVDGDLTRDPSEVYDNGRYKYKNGVVLGHDDDTKAEFFTDNGLGSRGIAIDNSRVGQESTARTFLARILERDSTENDTITLTVRLPPEQAGLIQAGQRIAVKLVHLENEGYGDFTYSRVTSLTITSADTIGYYDLSMTLNSHGAAGGGGGGAPGPDDFPHPPPATPTLVQSATRLDGGSFTLPRGDPLNGDDLYLWLVQRSPTSSPAIPTGWTSVGTAKNTSIYGDNFYARLVTKVASSDTTATLNAACGSGIDATFMEWGGSEFGAAVQQSDQGSTTGSTLTCGGAITPTAANAVVVGCGIVGTFDVSSVAPNAGVVELADFGFPSGNAPANWVGYKPVATPTATTIGGPITGRSEYGGVTFTLLPTADFNPPDPGQEVPWAVVEMTTSGGMSYGITAFPFSPATLKVRVDGVDITTASFVVDDAACGLFHLTWEIDPDETVTVSYDGT